MQVYLVLALIFALVVAVFAVQNSAEVQISFLTWQLTTSVAVVVIGGAVLGALIAGMFGLIRQFGMGLKIRSLNSRLSKAEELVRQLQAEKNSSTDVEAAAVQDETHLS